MKEDQVSYSVQMNVVFQACLLKLTVSVYKVTTGLPIMPCSAVYKLHKQNGCFN